MTTRIRQVGVATRTLLLVLALVALAYLYAMSGDGGPGTSLPTLQPRTYRVASADMVPTLLPGDRVHVDAGAYAGRDPAPGEVVLIDLGAAAARHPGSGQLFVGRVVGLPGDVVKATANGLVINRTPAPRTRLREPYADPAGRPLQLYRQTLGKVRFLTAQDRRNPGLPLEEKRVETDRYLVLGDYRTRAYDSRTFGTLHREQIVGPVTFVYYSSDPRSGATRWSRIGDLVR